METTRNHYSTSAGKTDRITNFEYDWSNQMPGWDSRTSTEVPIWQYNATGLNSQEHSTPYYPSQSPISPYIPSAVPSAINSPNTGFFPADPRFAHAPSNPNQYLHGDLQNAEQQDNKDFHDDEDSDTCSGEPTTPPDAHVRLLKKEARRRVKSANEVSLRNAKRAHTVVERNYRERLNDKIADLGLYLFETTSDSRTKPSKSLVMTRAKERLQQLECRNKSLEDEVVKLRQHIAILDHIVMSRGGSKPSTQPSCSQR